MTRRRGADVPLPLSNTQGAHTTAPVAESRGLPLAPYKYSEVVAPVPGVVPDSPAL